jgi:hypothetical protein
MRLARFTLPVVAAVLAITCTQRNSIAPTTSGANVGDSQSAATPLTAEVQFGLPNVGTGIFPPGSHDQSAHANDTLVPQSVTINLGGTVTYHTFGVHRVSIYAPGKTPQDIDTSITIAGGAGCPPVPIIADPNGFVTFLAAQPCAGGNPNPSFTPTQRGKYLVICPFLPHFTEFQMWGWLHVK